MNNHYAALIIGGGTAGWLTALYMQKYNPGQTIALVESDKIPSVGAGEGTTPQIVSILKSLDITEEEFLRKTNGTKKFGVRFTNWSGNDDSFPNYFFSNRRIDYAYHFDSALIIAFLKGIAKSRGIIHIIDKYTGCERNGENITRVHLEKTGNISAEHYFDCSGFARLLIGKEYNTKWISTKKYLPVNSAIPFSIERKSDNPLAKTYTDAVAMKHGWLWQIPLQHRYGCGYVFDNTRVSDDDARAELEEYMGQKLFNRYSSRIIHFESGYYKDLYRGNTFAIGLSGGFFEPLEATSLMTVCQQLLYFTKSRTLQNVKHKEYNDFFRRVNDQIMIHLKYHYLSIKDDTPFWRNQFTSPIPNNLYKLLNNDFTFKPKTVGEYKKLLGMNDNQEYLFTISNWKVFSRLLIEKYNIPVHARRSLTSKIKSLLNIN